MTPTQQLEADFENELITLCNECIREWGKDPTRLRQMVLQAGGRRAAKTLLLPDLNHRATAAGELDPCDDTNCHLTLEYVVVQNRYRGLFSPAELEEAEMRLQTYQPKRTLVVNLNYY